MKPTELRIGNVMCEKYTGTIIEVIELKKESITFSGNFNGEWQAEPIPLTEEMLLKFGAFHTGIGRYGIYNTKGYKFIIEKQENWYFFGISHGIQTSFFIWEIYHVHQLQNIWFAINAEELKLAYV